MVVLTSCISIDDKANHEHRESCDAIFMLFFLIFHANDVILLIIQLIRQD